MELSIKQRFVAVGLYVFIAIAIVSYLSNFDYRFVTDTNNKFNAVFIVIGLSLLLGMYVTEPYFTKPIDVITRWVSILLFVIGLNGSNKLLFASAWIYASIFFIIVSLIIIFFRTKPENEKFQQAVVLAICKISRPDIIFGALYFNLVWSFFQTEALNFAVLWMFGVLLVVNKPIETVVKILTRILHIISNQKVVHDELIGKMIGHESIDFYKVEVLGEAIKKYPTLRRRLVCLDSGSHYIIGIAVEEKYLLNKKWLEIFSLRDDSGNLIFIDKKSLEPTVLNKTIFSDNNQVYLVEPNRLPDHLIQKLATCSLYKNQERVIGYVTKGSNIRQIRFETLFDRQIQQDKSFGEGLVIESYIGTQHVLYQIIDGNTLEENLEYKDSYGFTTGVAQKLGTYDEENSQLNTVKWLPQIYSPVYMLQSRDVDYDTAKYVGKLPGTAYGIKLASIQELVTHNTAILGILGIGKSCLTFELLQKLFDNTQVKIFCIDITNQYTNELSKYIPSSSIQNDISTASQNSLKATRNNQGTNESNFTSWGNLTSYEEMLDNEIKLFIESDKRVIILNPDWHAVTKAATAFKISSLTDVSPAEKTKVISRSIFKYAKDLGETVDARYLIVMEEAHSLIPEWNSVSHEGDASATNGTAKVVLQGRKFGLGCMVITQRTANISKSILNQCNTIFALRVFDDTGKQFLENYIGSEYSNLLPTLEERHAVAIGKALKLKQPVIIQLNDKNDICLAEGGLDSADLQPVSVFD